MTGKVRLTTICDNKTPGRGLLGEHGLSIFLEAGERRFLFDTGTGQTLLHNAGVLGIDLSKLDAILLSHGHYDHTGGLLPLSEKVAPAPVYAHPDIFIPKYHALGIPVQENAKYIGPPWSREHLEGLGVQFHLQREPVDFGGGVMLTGEISRLPAWTHSEPGLQQKTSKGFRVDPFSDDQSLVVESSKGIVVVLGCAHAGLVNILQHVVTLTGKKHIYALLGGTHLLNASMEQLASIFEALEEFDLQVVAPCHCTGLRATFAFQQAFGDKFVFHQAGNIFEFD